MKKNLVIGAGITGATIARILAERGEEVLVVEKKFHVGGNCFTKQTSYGYPIHVYGAHIFHTDTEKVWSFVNRFAKFSNYRHKVIACYGNEFYSFPINLKTLSQVTHGEVNTSEDAQEYFKKCNERYPDGCTLEEHALHQVGKDIYNIFIKGYTEKQWGKDCKDLPASIIKRIPIRTTTDDTYFNNAKYQGIPIEGYTSMIVKMLDHENITCLKNVDFTWEQLLTNSEAKTADSPISFDKIYFTGPLDMLFGGKFGKLEWRSCRFEEETLDAKDFQGNSVVNYTSRDVPYTRIIEHCHFVPDLKDVEKTIITREYPERYVEGKNERMYPVNNSRNMEIAKKYLSEAEKIGISILGRLAEYKYLDMDKAIENVFNKLNY